MKKITLNEVLTLPEPEPGWFDLGFSVSVDDALQILRAAGRSATAVAPGTQARLLSLERAGAGTTATDAFPLEWPAVLFDRMSDGNWVIATPGGDRDDENGRVVTPSGDVVRRFVAGRGVKQLQCDRNIGIWVSYSDQGPDAESLSASGLIQFTSRGAPMWRYPAWLKGHESFVECWAMTVVGHELWMCMGKDFPIIHVSVDRSLRSWKNDFGNGSIMAVDGNMVALIGANGGGDGVLVRLGERESELLGRFQVDAYDTLGFAVGRGAKFHFVSGRQWLQISVPEIAGRLGVE